MSEIYVRTMATAHELYANRIKYARRLKKDARLTKEAIIKGLSGWSGYFYAALLGALVTLLFLRAVEIPQEVTAEPDAEAITETVPEAVVTIRADAEARALAKLLYCMVPNHSREDQEAVCWCVINRCESPLYPDSIAAVVQQPSQWVGYGEDAPVVQQYYDIAQSVLSYWRSGEPRPVTPDFLWLDWSKTDVELRNSFEITKETRYW